MSVYNLSGIAVVVLLATTIDNIASSHEISLSSRLLYVQGTSDGDDIRVSNEKINTSRIPGRPVYITYVVVTIEAENGDLIATRSLRPQDIDEMVIVGGKGWDDITNDTDIPSRIYGNEGMDYIWGGSNDDVINGGDDDDIIFGRGGDDTVIAGDGTNDGMYFFPNFLDGGSGNDTFIYNGHDMLAGYGRGSTLVPDEHYTSGLYEGMSRISEYY